jgi:hypothetical protein
MRLLGVQASKKVPSKSVQHSILVGLLALGIPTVIATAVILAPGVVLKFRFGVAWNCVCAAELLDVSRLDVRNVRARS